MNKIVDFSQDFEEICALKLKERHSYYQLQYFLIGKEPTTQSRLWRCVRELKQRKDSILNVSLEIDELQDDIELLKISLEELEKKEKNKKNEIEIRKINRRITSKELKINELKEKQNFLEEESIFLIKAFKSLSIKEKIKPYDDLESQKEYWDAKLSQEFNLRKSLNLPMDIELLKTILAINSDAIVKQDLLKTIHNKEDLFDINEKLLEVAKNSTIEEGNKQNGVQVIDS